MSVKCQCGAYDLPEGWWKRTVAHIVGGSNKEGTGLWIHTLNNCGVEPYIGTPVEARP